jgi:hypothetical protein
MLDLPKERRIATSGTVNTHPNGIGLTVCQTTIDTNNVIYIYSYD